MNKKRVVRDSGDIYFIPLFLHAESPIKSFTRYNFDGKEQEFCFFRVIEDLGAGIMIEVFDFVGDINSDINEIVNSQRLFNPIYIAGEGILKKRWRKIGETKSYDKEKDSNYSSIQFLIGPYDALRLVCNGVETKIDDSQNIEDIEEYVLWTSSQVEERILESLGRL